MTQINKLAILSLFSVLIFSVSAFAQVKANQPKLGSAQGPGGNVHAGLEDRKGNLWFVTTGNGVYRYDGKAFTNFTTSDGLINNSAFSILEDKKGNIWIGTSTGVSLYNGKSFTNIPLPPRAPATTNMVTALLEDKSGQIWIGADNGIYCYDGKNITWLLDKKGLINSDGLKPQIIQCIIVDKQGNIWFTTKMDGICRYDGRSLVNFKPDNESWFRGLLEDKNGMIWVGTRYKGVYRYDGKSFTHVTQNEKFDTYTVLSILQDKSGNIWFCTEAGDPSNRESEGGVWVYNGTDIKNFTMKDGLSNNAVWCAVEDKEGNLWFGTRKTGLSRYNGRTFTTFSK